MTTSDSMFEEYFNVRQYTPKSSGEQTAFRVISFSIFHINFLRFDRAVPIFFSSIQEKKVQSHLYVNILECTCFKYFQLRKTKLKCKGLF